MRKLLLPISALVLAATLSACGGSGTTASDSNSGSPAATTTVATTPATSPAAPSNAAGTCDYPADGQQPAKQVTPPPATPTQTGTVAVTIKTNQGDLHATLDAGKTPCTVNSFLSLAGQKYFDATACHRLTTVGIYVLQCGDPTGTGTGGPGYAFADELSGSETYPAGTLAMANTGQPVSNGSQFFIVYGDSMLPPAYTVFGKVDAAGIKLVQTVAKAGSDNANGQGDGHPKKPVKILSVSVG